MIMIEASPAAYPSGMLAVGKQGYQEGGDLLCGGFCQALFIIFLVCRYPLPSQIFQPSSLRLVLRALECVGHPCLQRPSIRVGLWTPTTRSCMRLWHLESAVVDSPFSRSVRNVNPVSSRAAHPHPISQRDRLPG